MAVTTNTLNHTVNWIAESMGIVFGGGSSDFVTFAGIVGLIFFLGLFMWMGMPVEVTILAAVMLGVTFTWAGLLPGWMGWLAAASGGLILAFALLKLRAR